LERLFRHIVNTFLGAQGRKLTTLEAHSIMCMVLDIVVVGGVRRAAGLALFDFDDELMLHCKDGEYWLRNPELAMANNSAVFYGRPSPEQFEVLMTALIDGNSGEPGIFNREAARAQASRWGRRSAEHEYGCNPCGEIILRDRQLCNLSAAVARPEDSLFDLTRKYRLAARLGVVQSTLTNFRYLHPAWRANCEEERLTGPSLDGIPDHPVLNGSRGEEARRYWLRTLRNEGRAETALMAWRLGINEPTAAGTLKPAGNSSVLTAAASPLKPHHGRRIVRRTRIAKTDPVYHFLVAHGAPIEDELLHPESTAVISWPVAAPAGAKTRHDWTAGESLRQWLAYRDDFTEHNPSCTINVRPDEWEIVKRFAWENFHKLTGITFLPDDGGVYQQAPYEELTDEQWAALEAQWPELDWSLLPAFEGEDLTTGTHELSCSSGLCEVDLSGPILPGPARPSAFVGTSP